MLGLIGVYSSKEKHKCLIIIIHHKLHSKWCLSDRYMEPSVFPTACVLSSLTPSLSLANLEEMRKRREEREWEQETEVNRLVTIIHLRSPMVSSSRFVSEFKLAEHKAEPIKWTYMWGYGHTPYVSCKTVNLLTFKPFLYTYNLSLVLISCCCTC